MIPFPLLARIARELFSDRLFQCGTGSSTLSLFGGRELYLSPPPQWLGHAQLWVALLGTVVGVLVGVATLTYTVLRIRALMRER